MPTVAIQTAQIPEGLGSFWLSTVRRINGSAKNRHFFALQGFRNWDRSFPEGPGPSSIVRLVLAIQKVGGDPSVSFVNRHVDSNNTSTSTAPSKSFHLNVIQLHRASSFGSYDGGLDGQVLHGWNLFNVDAL
eukprot:Skav234558  [mRNA]  locus=scaffold2556:489323:491433:- [translate_table: standard]